MPESERDQEGRGGGGGKVERVSRREFFRRAGAATASVGGVVLTGTAIGSLAATACDGDSSGPDGPDYQ